MRSVQTAKQNSRGFIKRNNG